MGPGLWTSLSFQSVKLMLAQGANVGRQFIIDVTASSWVSHIGTHIRLKCESRIQARPQHYWWTSEGLCRVIVSVHYMFRCNIIPYIMLTGIGGICQAQRLLSRLCFCSVICFCSVFDLIVMSQSVWTRNFCSSITQTTVGHLSLLSLIRI